MADIILALMTLLLSVNLTATLKILYDMGGLKQANIDLTRRINNLEKVVK